MNKRVVMWCQHIWEENCFTDKAMQFNSSHLSQPCPSRNNWQGKVTETFKSLQTFEMCRFVRNFWTRGSYFAKVLIWNVFKHIEISCKWPFKKKIFKKCANMMPNCKVIVTLWPDRLNLQPHHLAVQLDSRKFKPLMRADVIWDVDDSVSVVMKLYFTVSGFTLTNTCIISTWTNGARSQSSLIVHLTLENLTE